MRRRRGIGGPLRVALPLVTVLAGATFASLAETGSNETPPDNPGLVTFGPLARVNEGDHDFRQLIRFSLPAAAGNGACAGVRPRHGRRL